MSDGVVYEYDEVHHGYEGMQVPCRNCTALVFVKYVPSMGCHMCDAPPRDITIKTEADPDA